MAVWVANSSLSRVSLPLPQSSSANYWSYWSVFADTREDATHVPGVRTSLHMPAESELVRWCFEPSQPQKDYIRAEGGFHKDTYS